MSQPYRFVFKIALSALTIALVGVARPVLASRLAFPAGNPVDTTGTAVGTAPATLTTAKAAARMSPAELNRLAYMLAWRNSREADHHEDAQRLTALLAERLGLPAESKAHQALEAFLDNELAVNPGRFNTKENPEYALTKLLSEDMEGFQRVLSPLLDNKCYERYVALLDELRITAQ